jgi:hypothetical protein
MNRNEFLTKYRAELLARYPWASDTTKLDRFMTSVVSTLNGENTWNYDGDAVTAAWRAIGGKGKPTKKALRGLA